MNPLPLGSIAICFTGILLGLIPLFKGALQDEFNCTMIALLRVVVALMCITLAAIRRKAAGRITGPIWPARSDIPAFLGYGCISLAAMNFFYIKSLTLTSAVAAVVSVFAAAPLTALAAGFLMGSERPGKKETGTILLSAFGCFLVNIHSTNGENQISGIAYAVLAGVCYGLYSAFGKRAGRQYDYTVAMFWQFLIAAAFTGLLGMLLGGLEGQFSLLAFPLPGKLIIGILGIGVISTFLPYLLYSYGLKQGVKAPTASALTLLEPVSACVVAALFLDESINWIQFLGGSLTVGCSFLLARQKN